MDGSIIKNLTRIFIRFLCLNISAEIGKRSTVWSDAGILLMDKTDYNIAPGRTRTKQTLLYESIVQNPLECFEAMSFKPKAMERSGSMSGLLERSSQLSCFSAVFSAIECVIQPNIYPFYTKSLYE